MYRYKMEKSKIYRKSFITKNWIEVDKNSYLKKVNKKTSIIEDTLNFNLFKYLNDKYENDFYNGLSDFGQEVTCSIVKWKEDLVETIDGYLCGDLELIIDVKSKETNKILVKTYYKMFIKINKKVSKRLIELLFERAFSGTFVNPWLEEEIQEEMKRCDLIPKNSHLSYCCDECGLKCNGLKELLSHLIEENHYDSIFYRYRNSSEIRNIYNKLNLERKIDSNG